MMGISAKEVERKKGKNKNAKRVKISAF